MNPKIKARLVWVKLYEATKNAGLVEGVREIV